MAAPHERCRGRIERSLGKPRKKNRIAPAEQSEGSSDQSTLRTVLRSCWLGKAEAGGRLKYW